MAVAVFHPPRHSDAIPGEFEADKMQLAQKVAVCALFGRGKVSGCGGGGKVSRCKGGGTESSSSSRSSPHSGSCPSSSAVSPPTPAPRTGTRNLGESSAMSVRARALSAPSTWSTQAPRGCVATTGFVAPLTHTVVSCQRQWGGITVCDIASYPYQASRPLRLPCFLSPEHHSKDPLPPAAQHHDPTSSHASHATLSARILFCLLLCQCNASCVCVCGIDTCCRLFLPLLFNQVIPLVVFHFGCTHHNVAHTGTPSVQCWRPVMKGHSDTAPSKRELLASWQKASERRSTHVHKG